MSSIGIPEERLQTIRNRTEHHFQRDLYPWQIRAIKNILMRQRDTIVIAGTGSGKSLIFQSLQFATPDAIVLIVSPLVALMENQVNVPIDSSWLSIDSQLEQSHPEVQCRLDRGECHHRSIIIEESIQWRVPNSLCNTRNFVLGGLVLSPKSHSRCQSSL